LCALIYQTDAGSLEVKNSLVVALSAALIATIGASSAAQAAMIDFGVVASGGAIDYAGTSLDESSSLDLDGALLLVSNVGAGDDSGLAVFPSGTSNTVAISPSDIVYGFGTGPGPLGADIFKTWTAAGDSFTEDLTSVLSVNRATADAITVVLEGTLTDTDGLFPIGSPAFLILAASQAGGPGNGVAASLTNTSTLSAVPEPSTWVLMVLGFGALGYAASRARKSTFNVSIVTAPRAASIFAGSSGSGLRSFRSELRPLNADERPGLRATAT
jgi:PEP-CTERM motif